MKNLLLVFLLAIALNASSQKIGYIVSIGNDKSVDTRFFKTQSIEMVQKSIYINTGLDLDVDKIFEDNNVFFEFKNSELVFYCERKIVERKKSGKIVYKKINRKELQELIKDESSKKLVEKMLKNRINQKKSHQSVTNNIMKVQKTKINYL